MKCKNCQSQDIKVRKNFSHGKGSSARKLKICSSCGSTDIEMPPQRNFRRR